MSCPNVCRQFVLNCGLAAFSLSAISLSFPPPFGVCVAYIHCVQKSTLMDVKCQKWVIFLCLQIHLTSVHSVPVHMVALAVIKSFLTSWVISSLQPRLAKSPLELCFFFFSCFPSAGVLGVCQHAWLLSAGRGLSNHNTICLDLSSLIQKSKVSMTLVLEMAWLGHKRTVTTTI